MQLKTLRPMLHTLEMDKTIEWYIKVLGFDCIERDGHIWCLLARDDVSIMFMQNAHFGSPHATATQYIYVDDVSALWQQVQGHCHAEWGPEDFGYGLREFAVRDPNGYLLSFGQPIDSGQA